MLCCHYRYNRSHFWPTVMLGVIRDATDLKNTEAEEVNGRMAEWQNGRKAERLNDKLSVMLLFDLTFPALEKLAPWCFSVAKL